MSKSEGQIKNDVMWLCFAADDCSMLSILDCNLGSCSIAINHFRLVGFFFSIWEKQFSVSLVDLSLNQVETVEKALICVIT